MFTPAGFMRGVLAIALLLIVGTADAQAQIVRVDSGTHSITFNLGYFSVRGDQEAIDEAQDEWLFRGRPLFDPDDFDTGRARGDVLIGDLFDFDAEPLAFQMKDFNGPTVGGEWNVALSDYLEAGVGIGFYQRTVHSVYLDVISESGAEIEQDLKLRVIPMSATVKFLPLGRGGFEPYVGAGIGAFNWRYTESGEFVDTFDYSLFRARYEADGTAVGPVVLGGIRVPVADVWTFGGELRYQKAEGKIDADSDLLGDRIDLGGWNASFTLGIRF